MPTSETEINLALAEVPSQMRSRWSAQGEPLRAFAGNDKRPDVLVQEKGVAPVVVETEVYPALTVERDALVRLGESIFSSGSTIVAVVALRVPTRFRDFSQSQLRDRLKVATDLEYTLFIGDSPTNASRFPKSGWLVGRVFDLANLIHIAAVPEAAVEAATTLLEEGVTAAAGLLGQAIDQSPDVAAAVAIALRQEAQDSLQTRRMAMTIVTNAFVFHENLAGSHGIRSVDELRDGQGLLSKTVLLDEWRKIRQIDYYPIFHIAQALVTLLPQFDATRICDTAARTAGQLVAAGVTSSHDLTGTVFQRLIADRKFLAT